MRAHDRDRFHEAVLNRSVSGGSIRPLGGKICLPDIARVDFFHDDDVVDDDGDDSESDCLWIGHYALLPRPAFALNSTLLRLLQPMILSTL